MVDHHTVLSLSQCYDMEEALDFLRRTVDDQEFLRLTRTVLRVVQNVLNDPDSDKFRTVRAACKVRVQTPGQL